MKITHLTASDYTVGRWSGGETTQLYIYPAGADYARRQFKVRVSSARVELQESDFTPLEGILRYITPLEGGFALSHEGKEPKEMKPLDPPYCFEGGWATHCAGKAVDFNLMLKDCGGYMTIEEGLLEIKSGLSCIYPIGGGQVSLDGKGFDLSPGDMLVLELAEGESLETICPKAIYCHAQV